MTTPFDPGLQPERTSLSWMRFALAVSFTGAFTIRITIAHLGAIGMMIGLLSIGLALGAATISNLRYQKSLGQLHSDGSLGTEGLVLAMCGASIVIFGLLATVFVIWRFLGL